MAKFVAMVKLYINEFDADGLDNARDIVDSYVDLLAKTGGELSWEEVDFDCEEVE